MRVSGQWRVFIYLCFAIVHARAANWTTENMLAVAAYERGNYAVAEEHDRVALSLAESFDKNDPRLEATLTNLGAVLQARGACCDAERLLSRALAIETHEGWLEAIRYLNMEHLKEHKKETLRALAA